MIKIVLISSVLFFTLSCSSSSGPEDGNNIINDRPEATAFTSTTIRGETISLSDYKGKVVYLFFLGSYCSTCKANAPGTVTVDNKYSNAEVQVLGLDVWDGSGSQILDFIGATGVQYPILQNARNIQDAYDVSYDYSVLVDKQGRLAYRKEGVNSAEISTNIDALLEE